MKEINTDCIDRILNAFLKDNNIKCSIAFDTDFYYYCDSNHIGYALVVTERSARLYPQFCKDNGLNYEVPIFILCFLHEIGHHYTFSLFDYNEHCDFEDEKEPLGDSDEDFVKYFAIQDEYEATMWAIDFINTHPSKIKSLDLALEQAFNEFCAVNGIED